MCGGGTEMLKSFCILQKFNLLKTKPTLLYLRNKTVPRSKHLPSQLQKPIS